MHAARLRNIIVGLVLIAAGVFVVASILTYDPYEGPFSDFSRDRQGQSFRDTRLQPPARNICGRVGSSVSAYALAFLGWPSAVLALAVVLVGCLLTAGVKPARWPLKALGAFMGLVALTIALAMPHSAPAASEAAAWRIHSMSSGAAGMLLTRWLYADLGQAGTLTVLLLLASVSALLLGGAPLLALFGAAGRHLRRAASRLSSDLAPGTRRRGPAPAAAGPHDLSDASATVETAVAESRPRQREPSEPSAPPAQAEQAEPEGREPAAQPQREPPAGPEVITSATLAAARAARKTEIPRRRDGARAASEGEYELPPIELLNSLDDRELEEDEDEIRQKGLMLAQTLSEFKVDAQVVRVQRGPVITMYELSLAKGTKVARVEALSDDLAIALKAPNVRIVAPLPGKNTIGIEVPKSQRELVGMRELIEEMDKKTARMAIPLFLGRDTAGHPLFVDLAGAPHLLLAGATGSGKSVAVNSIICSILMTRTPREVQLLLVDPKSVEFSDYRQLPHLICPVLTDMKKAAAVLQWACKKMDERYAMLSRTNVRDIGSYNKLGQEEIVRRLNPEEDAQIDDVPFYMPHVVIVVDELGELMMVAAKEVESSVIRLSQKARAVGIHMICATQRPSVDVVTGLIKANLPARISFHVSSKVDSRTILDRNGAELLLGRGDMLMLPPGSSRLVRAQGTFVAPEEMLRIVEFWCEQGAPQYRAELREYHAAAAAESEGDELYDDAVRIVLETRRGSVSLLQRRLSIGYSRAARLIDLMAETGVVGAYKGSQAREVVLSLEEWEQARQKAR